MANRERRKKHICPLRYLTSHKAFRKISAMHLNRNIIIMTVTSKPGCWCCFWRGGGALASESKPPRTVDLVTPSRCYQRTFYHPSARAPGASTPEDGVTLECGIRWSGDGLILYRSVVRGGKKCRLVMIERVRLLL